MMRMFLHRMNVYICAHACVCICVRNMSLYMANLYLYVRFIYFSTWPIQLSRGLTTKTVWCEFTLKLTLLVGEKEQNKT